MRKNRTPDERKIIYDAAMAGCSRSEANKRLQAAGFRNIPPGSYSMVCKSYAPVFRKYPNIFQECIKKPRIIGDLPK